VVLREEVPKENEQQLGGLEGESKDRITNEVMKVVSKRSHMGKEAL